MNAEKPESAPVDWEQICTTLDEFIDRIPVEEKRKELCRTIKRQMPENTLDEWTTQCQEIKNDYIEREKNFSDANIALEAMLSLAENQGIATFGDVMVILAKASKIE